MPPENAAGRGVLSMREWPWEFKSRHLYCIGVYSKCQLLLEGNGEWRAWGILRVRILNKIA